MPRSRKFNGYCEKCKKPICSCSAYQYVDGNNEKYHTKIMNDVERFKSNLISTLCRIKHEQKIQKLDINKLIDYISNS